MLCNDNVFGKDWGRKDWMSARIKFDSIKTSWQYYALPKQQQQQQIGEISSGPVLYSMKLLFCGNLFL